MAANTSTAPEKRRAEAAAPVGFRSLRDEIDRMFHAFSLPEMNWRTGLTNWADDAVGLRVDVAETETDIQVTADLPGFEEDAIDSEGKTTKRAVIKDVFILLIIAA